jgi:two-component system, LytTR family, sensor kinase
VPSLDRDISSQLPVISSHGELAGYKTFYYRSVKIALPPFRTIAIAYVCSFGTWAVIATLVGVQQAYFENEIRAGHYRFVIFAVLFIRFFDFAILTPPLFFIVRQFPIERKKPLRGIARYALGAIPFMLTFTLLRMTIAPIWDQSVDRFVAFPFTFHDLTGVLFGTFGDQAAVYLALVGAAHAYTYFMEMRREEVERAELERALASSELQALKSQLHPHFLFNTLHGIATLIDTDRATAKAMVIKLSNLLRAALKHGNTDLIRLSDEVEFIQAYLDLEKMRLGSRLQIQWDVAPSTEEFLVPQLILQPLVENAIRHGIACCRSGGWLEIAARQVNGSLEMEVRNSVGGKPQSGMGVGMSNTRARLKRLFDDEATFSFLVAEGPIATATLRLPVFISHPAALPGKPTPGKELKS